jgi:hypothetical protein
MATNEEIIKQCNLTKQRINEGSKAVRDQIDNNVLPIIGSNQQAVSDKIMEARKYFTDGDQAAKRAINEAIAMLGDPVGPVDIIPRQHSYSETKQFMAPFFVPAGLIANPITRADLDWFANRMSKNIHGNAIRFFAFGAWEAYWKDWRFVPYEIRSDGKFDLDHYDEDYWDEVYWRIEAFTKRNIFVFVDLIDNCSLHESNNSHWGIHPWNGKNNVNGTSTWNNMTYHHYEEEHADKPGAEETAYYVNKFCSDFVARTYQRFKGRIGYGAGNEVHARTIWHRLQRDIVKAAAPDIPRDAMITSMGDDGFYSVDIYKDWIYSVHGKCKNPKEYTETEYLRRDEIVPDKQHQGIRSKRYIVSEDGCFPTKTADETKSITAKILADGRAGFEQNLRPLLVKENGKWISLYQRPNDIDWTFRSIDYHYAQVMKEAWFEFNNWPY